MKRIVRDTGPTEEVVERDDEDDFRAKVRRAVLEDPELLTDLCELISQRERLLRPY